MKIEAGEHQPYPPADVRNHPNRQTVIQQVVRRPLTKVKQQLLFNGGNIAGIFIAILVLRGCPWLDDRLCLETPTNAASFRQAAFGLPAKSSVKS